MEQIEKLWNQHLNTAFPQACVGEQVEDIELVLLDADTAGCIQTYIAQNKKLDSWRIAILGVCYRDLAITVRKLEGEPREYFERLENLARLTLQSLARRRKTS